MPEMPKYKALHTGVGKIDNQYIDFYQIYKQTLEDDHKYFNYTPMIIYKSREAAEIEIEKLENKK